MAKQEPDDHQEEQEDLLEVSQDTRELMEQNSLVPLWEVEKDMGDLLNDIGANIWKWEDIHAAIDGIENDVPIEDLPPGFQRRVAVPLNAPYAISNTIYVGVQTVSPGETAPSHRHASSALRFTIDGHEDMKTIVAGEEFPMRDNDLVTTPQWEWHDHVNDSDETAAWLDILDLPLFLGTLNNSHVFENHELERQPVTKTQGYWDSQYGRGRPTNEESDSSIPGPFEGNKEPTPPYRFQWSNMLEALRQHAENDDPDPYDGHSMAYVNPATGEPPVTPTMSFRAQLLQEATSEHFHNSTEVYFVIEGEGVTHVGGEDLEWGEKDIFVVPPDEIHHHEPDGEEAILLGITDEPVLRSMNFYAEAQPN